MSLPSFTRFWMWFGTRGYETWIPMPAASSDMSRVGSETEWASLNGGAGGTSSKAGHKVYQFAWNDAPADELLPILDYAEGAYDTGDGNDLIHFVTPDAAQRNAAPQVWANAAIASEDGMPLFWDQRPQAIPTAANPYRYPARTARYQAYGPSQKLYVPLPPGYVAWVGAHGSAEAGAGVRVTPVSGPGSGLPTILNMLSVINPVRCDTAFSSGDGYSGIEIDLLESGKLRNLSPNPSFEVDISSSGMAAPSSSTVGTYSVIRQANGRFGSYSMRASWSAPASGQGGGLKQTIPVAAGKTYSFSTYYRTSLATRIRGRVVWYDAANNVISQNTAAGTPTTATPAWSAAPRLVYENLQAPTGAISADFIAEAFGGSGFNTWNAGSWFEIDGVQVNEGATIQAYADGNSTGWNWSGSVGTSYSRQSPAVIQLTAIIIQLLPIGMTPKEGGWVSGHGNTGCQFLGAKPKYVVTSAGLDRVNMSAKLTETGAWV